MTESSEQASRLDELAEEFVNAWRRGERPQMSEYIARNPDLADEIRELFPSIVLMEEVRPEASASDSGLAGSFDFPRAATGARLERLGDFRILREVGRGGMGIVYEAEQESLGRHVALKILPRGATLDERHLQRFHREARAAAALHHSNIIPVFGVGAQDGLHYFVMQFIQGRGLDEVLTELRRMRSDRRADREAPTVVDIPPLGSAPGARAEQGRELASDLAANDTTKVSGKATVPDFKRDANGTTVVADRGTLSESGHRYWLSVARIGVQVADALAYAHGQGLLHRDIKPANLLLDAHGVVWVADFGLAKSDEHDTLTHSGDIVGTLRYLAPERLQGRSGAGSDIYGLGATLYELLTLRPMFDELDRARLIRQILDTEPAAPHALAPDVPRDLETIVLKAIAKSPADRYASAQELAADLRRFLDDKPILARRMRWPERMSRWCRRNPIEASLTLAVGTLLVAALAILAISNARIRSETKEREAALERAVAGESLARRRFYAAEMNLAANAFDRAELARMIDLLENHRPAPGEPDLRGFEWFHLWSEAHRGLHCSFRQPEGETFCIAFSPDGRTLVVGGSADNLGALKSWDAETGELRAKFVDTEAKLDTVAGVEFSEDGRYLASGSADHRLRIWDVAERKIVKQFTTEAGIRSLRWSAAAKSIALGCQDGSVYLIDPASCEAKATWRPFSSPVLGLAFSGDGRRLHAAVAWSGPGQRTVTFDVAAPEQPPVELADRFVTDADTESERVAGFHKQKVTIHAPSNPASDFAFDYGSGWLNNMRFSKNGRLLATAGFEDRVATVWDLEARRLQMRRAHAAPVQVVAFDPTGKLWASASTDGHVKIWRVAVAEPADEFTSDSKIQSALLPDSGGPLLLGGGFSATGRDLDSGRKVDVPPVEHLRAISADGHTLVSVDSGSEVQLGDILRVWDRETGRLRFEWTMPDSSPIYAECVAVSSSARFVAARALDLPVRVWECRDGGVIQRFELPFNAMQIAFSPDERYLAAACQFGRVQLVDLTNGQVSADLKGYSVSSDWARRVSFSPDGRRIAAGNSSGTVQVWDFPSGRPQCELKGHLGNILALAFFPDGRRIAVGSHGSIKLWDCEIAQELITLNIGDDLPSSLSVTPDGRKLVSLLESGVVRVWHAPLERP